MFFNGEDHLEHQLNVQFLGSFLGDFDKVDLDGEAGISMSQEDCYNPQFGNAALELT